ncbi:hypothetical protein HME9302_00482 [Alteripontixanthobacter maritimus]|uniref:Pilus assembly protein CpaD n=1 Tax=Alteripontixanthobacter maritimus TaxID=2161824 RepID=A0A369Q6X1_9SPHN|nr:CpaD family pilus assembly protein [Alteripontixanthobacter maritimus]RDC59295.1 hypothetical protein HME9302_00482 [Alteripontixanthobacter maritimus]
MKNAILNPAKLAGLALLSSTMVLGACGGMPQNRSLYSEKQPVVQRTNYALDVATTGSGLTIPEQSRLAAWFEAMDLRYGDRVSIEDPSLNPYTRNAVSDLAGRYGLLLSDGAPVTEGFVNPGSTRVIITRANAFVPGCPDWSAQSDMNYTNGTSPGYGCGVNSNLAAMVANPEDLLAGQNGTGETVIMSSTKAIQSYRDQAPTGENGVTEVGTD